MLKWCKWEGENAEHWILGAFEQSRLPKGPGVRLVRISEVEFLITQDVIIEKLKFSIPRGLGASPHSPP